MSDVAAPKQNPLLKLALEMGPTIVFFLANWRGDDLVAKFPVLGVFGGSLFFATAVFMVAMVIALTASWIINRTLAIMPLVTGVVVVVFGSLTLFLHDETFIKMKPTIINALFGGALLGGLLFGKALIEIMFESAFTLDEPGWRKLSLRWGLFFLFLAVLNEVVWRGLDLYLGPGKLSTDWWVWFKVWGTFPITLVFTMAQLPLLKRHGAEFG